MTSGPVHGDRRRPGRTLPRGWRAGVLGVLALLVVVLAVLQARGDSLTVDEGPDLAAGVSALVHRDLRVTPEHGVLPHIVAGLPALAGGPVVPKGEGWESGDWFGYTGDFVAANEAAGRLEPTLRWARASGIVVALLSALVIHVLAARWFGRSAALVASAAWLSTPLVIGIHHTILIDSMTALTVLVLVLATVRLIEAPSDGRAAAAGLALGALLLTRHSGLPLAVVPLVAAVATSTSARDRWRRAAVVVATPFAVMWATYRLVDPGGVGGGVRSRFEAIVDAASGSSLTARLVGSLPLPLEWRAGFGHLTLTSEPKTTSLLGQVWTGSRPWYFPVSLLMASPPLTFVLLVIGVVGLRGVAPGIRRIVILVGGGTAAISLVTLLAQPLQLGPRLALPLLALGLVLGSSAVESVRWAPWTRLVGVVLVASQVVLAVSSHPGSIGWTMPPARPSYRAAGAAATDIGQDLERLDAWAEAHRPVAVATVRSRGYPSPPDSRALRELRAEDVTGWVAVSVSTLVTFGADLAWLRAYCPIDQIGQSILVYRFDRPPDPTPGPDFPVRSCGGSSYSRRTDATD